MLGFSADDQVRASTDDPRMPELPADEASAIQGAMQSSKELKRPAIFNELEQYAATHSEPRATHESPHTTHYSVVDAQGNAVAVTTTINDWFGSRVTAQGLGFLMNDEMDDFSAKPGVPNADGLIQGVANAIGPGQRPLSSMQLQKPLDVSDSS